jgi:hypothetical protein
MSDELSALKKQRAEMFRQYLTAEGYLPTIDEDGDVLFKSEGLSFLIIPDEQDGEFFRLALPNFWSIDDEDERERVKIACLEVAKSLKVVKLYPVGDDTWAAVEMFVSPIQSAMDVFWKCLRSLHHAKHAFGKQMQLLQMQKLQMKEGESEEV